MSPARSLAAPRLRRSGPTRRPLARRRPAKAARKPQVAFAGLPGSFHAAVPRYQRWCVGGPQGGFAGRVVGRAGRDRRWGLPAGSATAIAGERSLPATPAREPRGLVEMLRSLSGTFSRGLNGITCGTSAPAGAGRAAVTAARARLAGRRFETFLSVTLVRMKDGFYKTD